MWWIAACLGALLWLLVVRIKLKEKEREAKQQATKVRPSEVEARRVFCEQGFLPAAREYLAQSPEVAALVLVFGHFAWDDKPSEVHMEVLPLGVTNGRWPEVATACAWVTRGQGGELGFDPPQAHWQRLSGLESWLDQLAGFAEVVGAVPGVTANLSDYQLYAWVRRDGEGVTLEVVGEPRRVDATLLQKQPI